MKFTSALIIASVITFSFILVSCEVPQDKEWYDRTDGQTEFAHHVQAVSAPPLIETVLFENEQTASGDTEVVFKTNDSSYNENENFVHKLIPTKPYPEIITVQTSKQQGSRTAGYGLIFAARTSSNKVYFLAVLINTNKQYKVIRNYAGNFSEITGWKTCNYLKTGYGVQNKITVKAVQKTGSTTYEFELYLNDIKIEPVIYDTTLNKLGAYGYLVEIPATEDFPNKFVEVKFQDKTQTN